MFLPLSYASEDKSMKTLILNIVPKPTPKAIAEENIAELVDLCQTAGGIVIKKIVQKRGRPSAKTFLGKGKIQEAADYAKAEGIELIIINGQLKPNHYLHLQKLFPQKKVMDRVDLILHIFEKHAKSESARLQIRLAQLEHEIPKIYARESTTLFERAGAGIGTRGAGEKGIEDEKRHIRRQIKSVKQKIEAIQKRQKVQRSARNRTEKKSVALVGYTNAGKSSLMNALTKKDVTIDDALFATLETRIAKLWLGPQKEVFLVDTIGFIRDLPPSLIAAFTATLEEAKYADLLLHVVDVSDPKYREKILVTESVLEQIGCDQIPSMLVFNKMDKTDHKEVGGEGGSTKTCFLPAHLFPDAICTSMPDKTGLEVLKARIGKIA